MITKNEHFPQGKFWENQTCSSIFMLPPYPPDRLGPGERGEITKIKILRFSHWQKYLFLLNTMLMLREAINSRDYHDSSVPIPNFLWFWSGSPLIPYLGLEVGEGERIEKSKIWEFLELELEDRKNVDFPNVK